MDFNMKELCVVFFALVIFAFFLNAADKDPREVWGATVLQAEAKHGHGCSCDGCMSARRRELEQREEEERMQEEDALRRRSVAQRASELAAEEQAEKNAAFAESIAMMHQMNDFKLSQLGVTQWDCSVVPEKGAYRFFFNFQFAGGRTYTPNLRGRSLPDPYEVVKNWQAKGSPGRDETTSNVALGEIRAIISRLGVRPKKSIMSKIRKVPKIPSPALATSGKQKAVYGRLVSVHKSFGDLLAFAPYLAGMKSFSEEGVVSLFNQVASDKNWEPASQYNVNAIAELEGIVTDLIMACRSVCLKEQNLRGQIR